MSCCFQFFEIFESVQRRVSHFLRISVLINSLTQAKLLDLNRFNVEIIIVHLLCESKGRKTQNISRKRLTKGKIVNN